MVYLFTIIGLYLLSLLWIGVAEPWLNTQLQDQARWFKEQRALREELYRERIRLEKAEPPKTGIGEFLKFAFPIVRRVSPSLIAQSIVSVQPMTGPVGGVAFYRPIWRQRSGAEWSVNTWSFEIWEQLRETYGHLVDRDAALSAVTESIVRSVFQDNPYSKYHVKPRGAAHV